MSKQWNRIQLGKACEIILGQSPSSNTYNQDKIGLPFFQGKSEFGSKYAQAKTWCSDPIKIANKNDILISVRAPVGESNLAPDICCIGRGLAALRADQENLLQEFLWHQIEFKKVYLQGISQGSTFDAISGKDLSELQIELPPLPEQKKIAEILSGVDHAVDSISRLIAKEEALFKSLQSELLSGIAGAAFALPCRQDQVLKTLPVASLFEVQLGKMLNKEAKGHGHQFQYIGNKNVQQWSPDLRQLESMHFSDSERRKFSLKPFDLLVCEGGDAGRCCIWQGKDTEIYYQKAIHRMRPVNNDCLPAFMMHYLSYCKTSNLLSDFISRTSISHLTREKLLEVPVALPSHQEQSSIVKMLESQLELISKLSSKSGVLNDLKSSVASDLLSGRKRVTL